MSDKIQRGSVDSSTEPRFLVIGTILKPHGLSGEFRVEMHTDLPERFNWLEEVFIGSRDPHPYIVESVRFHKQWVLLKVEGIDDRNQVDLLRGALLQIPEEEAIPLEEGEYFLYEAVGLEVFDDTGTHLGKVVEVLETKANNVFVVGGEDGELLIPDIDEVIKEINWENGTMIVHLLDGLKG